MIRKKFTRQPLKRRTQLRFKMGAALAFALLFTGVQHLSLGHRPNPPLERDKDKDGLCDACEQEIFDTDYKKPDTDGDGVGEQRQIYSGGQLSRVEVDTNDDGRADVIQYLSDGNISRQCEDAEFDGQIDHCFEGESLVGVSGVTNVGAPLESLGCGSLHPFWRGR